MTLVSYQVSHSFTHSIPCRQSKPTPRMNALVRRSRSTYPKGDLPRQKQASEESVEFISLSSYNRSCTVHHITNSLVLISGTLGSGTFCNIIINHILHLNASCRKHAIPSYEGTSE